MPLYEFECLKCKARTADYFSYEDAPKIGSLIDCKACGGKARRLISEFHLRPEFFEFAITNVGDKPQQIISRRKYEQFRRDEYIRSTKGTNLEGTNGKLQVADKYSKQELQRKQKVIQEKREKSLKDTLVKARWKSARRKVSVL